MRYRISRAIDCFLSFLAIIVGLLDLHKQLEVCTFGQNLGKLCNLNLFDLEDFALWSSKLHPIAHFNQNTSHKNLVILAFMGAEMVGGGTDSVLLPSRARNSETHSRARVKPTLVHFACN